MRLRLLDRLGAHPALFPIDAAAIEVRTEHGPVAFHELLRDMLRTARRSISLSTLYLGTGRLEAELLADLRYALERNPELQVRLVMDRSRGRRKTDNGTSVSFVAELARDYPERVEIFVHRMPQRATHWLPSPLDECVAVCHFKTFVADDRAILTGANLSDEYFHCRQARYLLIREPRFADLLHGVVETAARHSLRVRPGQLEPPRRDPREVGQAMLERVIRAERPAGAHDTCLLPVFQHPALGLQQERELLRELLAWRDGELVINTPYTNFPPDYVEALAERLGRAGDGCPYRTLILLASGSSHSFTTGRGLKALVPGIYLHREKLVLARLGPTAATRLEVRHYHRPGWVFHSKGIWFSTEDETASVIGSSAFGARSVSRDFDMSCLIVTRDPRLRAALAGEVTTMLAHACAPGPVARRHPVTSQLLSPLMKNFM